MVNKIANWTFGGFFRTLGRFLAFLGIGLLVALFCHKNDIKIGSLLGIEYVNASVNEQWATKQVKIQTCNGNGDCSWSSNYDANHNFTGSDLTYPVSALEWRLKATSGLSIENSYTFSFGYKPTPDAIMYQRVFMRRGASYDDEDITCTNELDSNNYYMWRCSFSPREDYSSSQWLYVQVKFYQGYLTGLNTKISAFEERLGTNSVITEQTNNIINNQNSNTTSIINELGDVSSSITNSITESILSSKVCRRIDNASINRNDYYLDSNGNLVLNGSLHVVGTTDYLDVSGRELYVVDVGNASSLTQYYYCFYTTTRTKISCSNFSNLSTGQLTIPSNAVYFRTTIIRAYDLPQFSICSNGNQAINDSLSDIDDTLKDDDVESDTNDMGDFLNDFEFSSDSTISSLLLIPITFLENVLTTSSDANLCATWRNKTICLPSGALIWDRSDITAFQTFFNLFVGGYLSYKMIRSFIKTSESAINPKENKVEVMRL